VEVVVEVAVLTRMIVPMYDRVQKSCRGDLVVEAVGLGLRLFRMRCVRRMGWERYFEEGFLLFVLGFRIRGGRGSIVRQGWGGIPLHHG
jgi:hypothetical protein